MKEGRSASSWRLLASHIDGLTALNIARQKLPLVPFILVSGSMREDPAIESLKSGATDYVLKQKLSRLVPAFHRALVEAENRKVIIKGFQLESALLRINAQILEGSDTKDVMGTACEAIVEMGYRMCWIGLPDPERIIRPVAYKGFTDGYPEHIDIRWGTTSGEKGPTQIALQTGQPCVIQSIQMSPVFGPWREGSLRRRFLSMAAFPLVSQEGEALGVMNVYSDREGAFSDEEVGRLRMFAQQCWIAVMNARRIENLRDINQRLTFHVTRMPLACIVWNKEFDVMEWNPAAERIFGWMADEAIGKHGQELIVPEEAWPHVEARVGEIAHGRRGELLPECRRCRKDRKGHHLRMVQRVVARRVGKRHRGSVDGP